MEFPYLKDLIIIKCGFSYIALWIYCVFSICGDYICRSIQFLNNSYQSTFVGQRREEVLFFLQNFSREEKQGDALQVKILSFMR
jgi:hypothetical protein